jgi:hypothetical protein
MVKLIELSEIVKFIGSSESAILKSKKIRFVVIAAVLRG